MSANIRRTTWPLPCCVSVRTTAPAAAATRLRPVTAVVVVDVDGRVRQRLAETLDGRADRRFLIVARQEHGDAWLLLGGHHSPGTQSQRLRSPALPLRDVERKAGLLQVQSKEAITSSWPEPSSRPASSPQPLARRPSSGRLRPGGSFTGLAGFGLSAFVSSTAPFGRLLRPSAAGSAFGLRRPWLCPWRLGLRHVVAAARAVDMAFLGLEIGFELGAGRGRGR